MDKSDLGNRMKLYEGAYKYKLTPRTPLIIRLDGKSFHTYTKGFKKPLDPQITSAFLVGTKALLKNVQGAKLIYVQSDEVSILVNDYEMFETQPWFGKNLQKITSVSASILTGYFNQYMFDSKKIPAFFDSRAFILPKEEVCNYFIWRQLDCERNSVSSLAQSLFSHKQLQNKTCKDMKEMLLSECSIDWDDLPTHQKRGWCLRSDYSDDADWDIPRFSEKRDYVERYLAQIEE